MARLRSKSGSYDQGILASSSAPSAAFVGQIWFNNATGVVYQWTTDGASSFWLDISSGGIGTSTERGVDFVGDTDPHKATNGTGLAVGSVYYNREKNRHFVCTDATSGANVWAGRYAGSGGVETNFTSGTTTYRVHTFLTSGTFSVEDAITVDYLCIAGGGGGAQGYRAGGGGAGGYRNSVDGETSGGGVAGNTIAALTLTAGISYSIVVGAGGNGGNNDDVTNVIDNGFNGENSTISGTGISTVTALGGGAGGGAWVANAAGVAGGSGGGGNGWTGATNNGGGAASSPTQGYAGGKGSIVSVVQCGGGGGGAGAVGQPGGSGGTDGDGGAGLSSSITGSAVTRGGGGGGGYYDNGNTTVGGAGGGAAGSANISGAATAGTVNTGGGGGGAGGTAPGGMGGSGIVILRYTLT